MGTKNFSNANDLITFSRSSAGTALRKIAYGSELVTNGDFSTDSDWTKGSGWSISGGVAVSNNASGFTDIKQSVDVTPNKIYRLDFSVASYTSGAVVPYLGNNGSADATPYDQGNLTNSFRATSAGEFYAFFVFDASQPGQIVLRANSGFIGTIDNVSVKEVLFDDASGDLTLFNHPADVPRIEYDADGNVLGLLVEESRTNLVTYSEDFSNAAWNLGSTILNLSAVASPSGSSSYQLTATGSAAGHILDAIALTASASATASVFIKNNSSTRSALGLYSVSDSGWFGRVDFDWVDGTPVFNSTTNSVGSIDSYSFTEISDGWWRVSVTVTTNTNTSARIYIYPDRVSGAESVYIYGAQVEQGSFPTSYIPTSGATATRSADVASIPVSAFGYNQSEGTVVVGYQTATNVGTTRVVELVSDGSNRITVLNGAPSEQLNTFINVSGVTTANFNTANAATSGFNIGAVSFKEDDIAMTLNGGTVISDTSSGVPYSDNINIGSSIAGGKLNGHVKSIRYYPRRLTNAQLQELTS